MKTFVLTRNQYEKIKEVFEMYDTIDYVKIHVENSSGIGPIVTLEYNPSFVKVDITDVESW